MTSVKSPTTSSTRVAQSGSDGAHRTLQLLAAFSRERHTMTAKDLVTDTGIPLPSVYRYLGALRDSGFLVDEHRGTFRLSPKLIGLAEAAQAGDPLIEYAAVAMHALGRDTNETVLLVRLVDLRAVCVHRVESRRHLRISFEPGQSLPLTRGASARVLMAGLPAVRRRRTIESISGGDEATARDLESAVARTAEQGWATSEQEIDADVWAAAAPIMDGIQTIAALSVPSPLSRATSAVRADLIERVRNTAMAISRQVTEARKSALS